MSTTPGTVTTGTGFDWWQEGVLNAIDGYFDLEGARLNRPEQRPTEPDPRTNPAFGDGQTIIETLEKNAGTLAFIAVGVLIVALTVKAIK